jgi:hypothetical protein
MRGSKRGPRKQSPIEQRHPEFYGDTSPGAATIEELAPEGLQRLAHAQFGMVPAHTEPRAFRAPRRMTPTLEQAEDDPPRYYGDGVTRPPDPTAEEMLAFLRRPGVACITYKSGATLVFYHTDQFLGMTFDEAVAKAIRGHRLPGAS